MGAFHSAMDRLLPDMTGSGYVDRKKLYVPRPGYLDHWTLLHRMKEFGQIKFYAKWDYRHRDLSDDIRDCLKRILASGYGMSPWTSFSETVVIRNRSGYFPSQVGDGDNIFLCVSSAADILAIQSYWTSDKPLPDFRELP